MTIAILLGLIAAVGLAFTRKQGEYERGMEEYCRLECSPSER